MNRLSKLLSRPPGLPTVLNRYVPPTVVNGGRSQRRGGQPARD